MASAALREHPHTQLSLQQSALSTATGLATFRLLLALISRVQPLKECLAFCTCPFWQVLDSIFFSVGAQDNENICLGFQPLSVGCLTLPPCTLSSECVAHFFCPAFLQVLSTLTFPNSSFDLHNPG